MKIFGERVIVTQTMVKRKSVVLTPGGDTSADKFDVTQVVTMLGDEYTEDKLKVGDVPIFAKYADLGNTKVVSKTEDKIVTEIIVHKDDIIGIDDEDASGVVEKK